MNPPFVRRAVAMALACVATLPVLLVPVAAQAAYDLSGPWLLVPPGAIVRRLDIVQDGSALVVGSLVPGSPGYAPDGDGVIDEATGAFHLRMPIFLAECGGWVDETLDGTVSADGRTFTASLAEQWTAWSGSGSFDDCFGGTKEVAGTRCGNNRVEAWEQCDFGDAADGDCCSSSCQLAAPASACTSDTNDCTSDLCDAAGTCTHAAVEGSCAEPHGCGTGQCASGACIVSAPAAAGTACDLDGSVCTMDACDGAGVCASGIAMDCGPCGSCDDAEGCVRRKSFDQAFSGAFASPCSGPDGSIELTVRTGDNPKRRTLRLSMKNSMAPVEEDPTVDAWHLACLFEDDGSVSRPIFGAVVPPAAECGGQPCWEVHPYNRGWGRRYRYDDSTGATAGVVAMTVDGSRGFELKAAGENLALPAQLSTTSTLVPLVGSWSGGRYDLETGFCLNRAVTARHRTATAFRGGSVPAAP